MTKQSFSVLEYRYRDAANYKAEGRILLLGVANATDVEMIRSKLEVDDLFVPQQVGVPSLREQLWMSTQSEFVPEFDHCWHELVAFRAATSDEAAAKAPIGTVADLVRAFSGVSVWRVG